MKKLTILVFIALLVIGTTTLTASAKKFSLGIEAGYFAPGDKDFSDIYGSGGMTYGLNAGYRFFKHVSIQTAFDLYSAEGKTDITGADTKINLNNLRLGGYYHLNLKRIIPEIGAGLALTYVKEEDPFGGSKKVRTGWFAAAGVDIPVFANFLAGLDLIYHDVKLTGDFGSQSLGGLSLLLSLKIEL